MKMFLRSTMVGAVLLVATLPSYAASYVVSVCELQSHKNGWAYFKPCGTWPSKEGNADGWIIFELNSNWAKSAYTTLLIAHQTANPIRVGIETGNNSQTFDVAEYIRITQ